MKAKALRAQKEAESLRKAADGANSHSSGGNHGTKQPYSAINTPANVAPNQRDARSNTPAAPRPLDSIEPARNFTKYVEYDFSTMTDTKGGFLTVEDDPHNKALHARSNEEEVKPAHMTLKEWERFQLLKKLREQRSGPYQPAISVFPERNPKCRECASLDVDWQWLDLLRCAVCNGCKDKFPEKYSLLTKTEAAKDYLLTDPELKDTELLPHLERPNPHKSTFHNMMLYLRYQLEDYAFGKKWGSAERLDEEFEQREETKKKKKNEKFKSKLNELKKRTRVEAYKRSKLSSGGGGEFGDDLSNGGRHVHTWGRPMEDADGVGVKSCVECGMQVEELEL